jgi:hypothetical protein
MIEHDAHCSIYSGSSCDCVPDRPRRHHHDRPAWHWPEASEAMMNNEGRKTMNEARVQDGTMHSAEDFWQAIMDIGYIIEGENRAFERRKMKALDAWLNTWFAAHPEITVDGPLEHFAMHAVARLVHAFVFNDEIGADQPDHKELLLHRIIESAPRWPPDA